MSQPAFTQPRENFREFYESVATRYPEEEVVYQTLRGILRRQFVHSYLDRLRGRLLDLGCNRGAYLAYYQNGPSVGVDIARAVLQIARSRQPKSHYIQCDAQSLALAANSFDAILCSEVVEHLFEPKRLFHEMFRVLKAGGQVLLTTPNYTKEKPTWITIDEMRAYGVSGVDGDRYFHTAFRAEELRWLAQGAGFEVLESGTFEKEVKYATRIPVLLFHIFRLINKVTFRSQCLERLNKRVLEASSLLVYRLCVSLGLDRWLIGLVKEGVRSFVFLRKPSARSVSRRTAS